jgi:hypothetical protein
MDMVLLSSPSFVFLNAKQFHAMMMMMMVWLSSSLDLFLNIQILWFHLY